MSESNESSDISDGSNYYSETDISDVSFEDPGIVGLYNNEPEYGEEEIKKRKLENLDESATDSDDDLDSSRLENLHWCSCKNCVIGLTMTLDECKCCRECNILGEKLQNIEPFRCITDSEDFKVLCLNKTVLETACIRHRRYKNNFQEVKTFSNK